MEQIASGEWEEVIQEVVAAAERDQEWEMIGPRQAAQDDDGDGAGLPRQPSVPEPPPGANAGDEARLREEAFGELSVGDLPLDGTGLPRQPSVPEPGGPVLDDVLCLSVIVSVKLCLGAVPSVVGIFLQLQPRSWSGHRLRRLPHLCHEGHLHFSDRLLRGRRHRDQALRGVM